MQTTDPVLAILDLWSLGHSAAEISRKLAVRQGQVTVVVLRAREIGDPRAAVHVGRQGRPIGSPHWARRVLVEYPDVETIPAIPRLRCPKGHLRSPDNVDAYTNCRACHRERERQRRNLVK